MINRCLITTINNNIVYNLPNGTINNNGVSIPYLEITINKKNVWLLHSDVKKEHLKGFDIILHSGNNICIKPIVSSNYEAAHNAIYKGSDL